ncbi:MAG TPA: aspartyl protease family protein [Pyrinomonadaceae bacterium]|nr:aspartyl protease family protein [Pyrinomonadaceae bacterium]
MKYNRRANGKSRRLVALATLAFMCCVLSVSFVSSGRAWDDRTRSRAERALREGEYETAERLYRELLARDAHDNSARLGLSFALYKQRNFQDAYDHAARVIGNDPLSSRAHALLGAAVLGSGDFRLSVEEFRTALSIRENEALAIAGLALVDFYEGRLDRSLAGFRRAVSLDSNEPDYIYSLAQAAARTERYKEAADAYERFLIIAPRTEEDRRARIRGLIDFLRYLGRQNQLYDPSGASHTSIPFEIVNNRPIIQIRINGERKPLRFVIDTGSGMSVVSEETARRMNIHAVARGGLARAVGGGGKFEIVYGFIPRIDIGEVQIENLPVYIRHFYDDGNPTDGYIGIAALTKFIATVDYGARTFSLLRQRSSPTQAPIPLSNGLELPLRTTASGFLSSEVHLEGLTKPLNFIIDTGATVSVVSKALVASSDLERFAHGTRMRVYGAAGIEDNVKLLMLPRFMLGTLVRDHLPAAVLDLDPVNETAGFDQTGIVGGNFLRYYRVTFDFQRAVMRLESLGANQQPADTLNGAGTIPSP